MEGRSNLLGRAQLDNYAKSIPKNLPKTSQDTSSNLPLDSRSKFGAYYSFPTMNPMLTLWLLFCFLTFVCPTVLDPRDVDAPFLACYDYIICGGSSVLLIHNR